MSEPVLKAILQLMAVSASIDGVVTQAEKDVIDEFLDENLSTDNKPTFVGLFDEYADVAVQSGISIEKIAKKINGSSTKLRFEFDFVRDLTKQSEVEIEVRPKNHFDFVYFAKPFDEKTSIFITLQEIF